MNKSGMNRDSFTNKQLSQVGRHMRSTNPAGHTKSDKSSWLSRLVVVWLAGITAFLPIKILNLPSNFELVDIWIVLGLPVLLSFYSLGPRRKINLTYAIPIWLVMISSLLSTFASEAASNSLIVILKELYLFTWFAVVTTFLSSLNARDLRRVLHVWSVVVVVHGLLIIAQFLSPDLWRLTNSLGGNSARLADYRASGLFICDAAGCANKAAYFQLVGFVPLLLSGFSRKNTAAVGTLLLVSILATGSMGATLAFLSGLTASIFAIAIFKRGFSIIMKYFLQFAFAVSLLGGTFYIIVNQNSAYRDHFEKIIVGRFDKSSSGRFDLWQRGITVLLNHDALLWGVGPENFRVVDPAQTDNQLHNDTLAFLVERGLIGLLGLALFPAIAMRRAFAIVKMSNETAGQAQFGVVVLVGIIVATIVESLTHQLFRTRELWLVLALQEAIYFQMKTLTNENLPKRFVLQSSRRKERLPNKLNTSAGEQGVILGQEKSN